MNDPYTMDLELCDGAGVTKTDVLNRLRWLVSSEPYDGPPFPCTGHAHLAGQHIRCTSSAHTSPTPDVGPATFTAWATATYAAYATNMRTSGTLIAACITLATVLGASWGTIVTPPG